MCVCVCKKREAREEFSIASKTIVCEQSVSEVVGVPSPWVYVVLWLIHIIYLPTARTHRDKQADGLHRR